MYCYQCGTEITEQAKFCSGCGRQLTAQPAERSVDSMATHIHILAWLFIGTAILYGLAGFALMATPGILRAIPIPNPPDAPFDVVRFVSSIAGFVGVAILIMGGVNAAAGVGLLQYQSWGRTLALVTSALDLLKIPFGTALGIYGFWVLLSQRGREFYDRESALAEAKRVAT